MSAGFPVDKNTVDQRMGSVAYQTREMLRQCQALKAWLDGKQDADLTALGYTTDDVAVLRAAYTDLDKLAKIAHGQATQTPANDFFFWAGQLTGVQ